MDPGTTPLRTSHPRRTTDTGEHPAGAPRASILVVEDDPDTRTLLRMALDEVGFSGWATFLPNGPEAVEHLLGDGPGPEAPYLVLLDIDLPGISGLEVLERLRADARTRDVPVVVLTADPANEASARSYGADAFYTKPTRYQELVDILADVVARWSTA